MMVGGVPQYYPPEQKVVTMVNPPDEQKYLSVKEFRELGYLQELNRRFLHPLGLALEVEISPSGIERLGRIWDSRDDPEGIYFDPELIDKDKAIRIYREGAKKGLPRIAKLGFVVQPLEGIE